MDRVSGAARFETFHDMIIFELDSWMNVLKRVWEVNRS